MTLPHALLVASLLLADPGTAVTGAIERGPGNARFAGLTDTLPLSLDPSLVVRGDRFSVALPHGDEGTAAGTVAVTSIAGGNVTGIVIRAAREIPLPATLSSLRPFGEADRIYHPLLAWLAERWLADPERPIPVALTDMTDAAGNRTTLSDTLTAELTATLCDRGAFACVSVERMAAALWRRGTPTVAGLPEPEIVRFGAEVEATLVLTGRMVERSGLVELLVTVHPVAGERPAPWWRFTLPASRYPLDGPDRVTVAGRKAATVSLTIRLEDAASFGTIDGDELTYVDLAPRLRKAGMTGLPVRAERFFAELDGVTYPLTGGGHLFDGEVLAGARRIVVGFTPMVITPEGPIPLDPPVVREFSEPLTPASPQTIRFAGEARGTGVALVARQGATKSGAR